METTTHNNHNHYWGGVKDNAEECVEHILGGGNCNYTIHDAIGKSSIESEEDWDDLFEFCRTHHCDHRDFEKLRRASVNWLQAHNELEYKRLYP